MGLFDNPRSSAAEDLGPKQIGQYDDLINAIIGGQSKFQGVDNLQDVYSKFGLQPLDVEGYRKQVGGVYDPLRRNLTTQFGKQRSNLARTMGDRSATPGAGAAPIEGAYATALSGLESSQAQDVLGGYDKSRQQQLINAQMLESILGNQDAWRAGKANRWNSALSGKAGAINSYLSNLSNTSPFEDIASGGVDAAGDRRGR